MDILMRFINKRNNNKCSLYHYIQENFNGDFKMCYIELIENFECNNRNELNKREGELIRQYKADNNYIVINKNIAGNHLERYTKFIIFVSVFWRIARFLIILFIMKKFEEFLLF